MGIFLIAIASNVQLEFFLWCIACILAVYRGAEKTNSTYGVAVSHNLTENENKHFHAPYIFHLFSMF